MLLSLAFGIHLVMYLMKLYVPGIMACFSFLFIAALAITRTVFGQGTGPIYLNSVRCTGTESSLLSCSHSGIGVTYCLHTYDVGVVCPSCTLINDKYQIQNKIVSLSMYMPCK